MKRLWKKRLLALFLSVSMLLTLVPGAFALEDEGGQSNGLTWKQVDNDAVSAPIGLEAETIETPPEAKPLHEDNEEVRVSIVLEEEPTLALFSMDGENGLSADGEEYREALHEYQDAVAEYISEEVLDEPLDVVRNLTLVANIISANVKYGEIEDIKALEGIDDVIVETRFEIQGFPVEADPNMVISTGMTNTTQAWEDCSYTGAGTRIAIIDTGLDIEHQSFDNSAFLHALEEDAEKDEKNVSDYGLLDKAELSEKLSKLNIADANVSADELYYSEKIPFRFNYVDEDTDVSHMHDSQGEHGSHVAGIAAANRYIKRQDGTFTPALTTDGVFMSGNAPDAQVLVMKVFGKSGGAYEADYMAAIEDAIRLNCDTVNLSLGSGEAGMSFSSKYQGILDGLVSANTIVTMSAGNSGYWANTTTYGLPYSDDVNFHTGGSPGSYTNPLTVASVDNDGLVADGAIVAFGKNIPYGENLYGAYGYYGNNPIATLDPDGAGIEYDFVYVDTIGEWEDFEAVGVEGKIALCNRGTTNFSVKANCAAGQGALAVIICNNQSGSIGLDLTDYMYDAPVVSISQVNADYIKEHAVKARLDVADGMDADSEKFYYTGKLTIKAAATVFEDERDYKIMSSFSSWGIPGDLSLKPEITAPGGSIWSLFGATPDGGGHDQYESMSGTSMASPQMAGIGALVKQAIKTRKISQDGITDRALAQSLMMSTATPLKYDEDNYYPVIQQGAGMVDTLAAVNADSYILMDPDATVSWKDGKVKAELKDDPDKSGVYEVTFTINNLDGKAHSYSLGADVFTQGVVEKDMIETVYDDWGWGSEEVIGTAKLLSTATRTLAAHVQWSGAGVSDNRVTVNANGSAAVTAAITLEANAVKEMMDLCPNGFYVEAYLYAKGDPTGEGVQGTAHSIPVLGFYGNWTDPSMFEKGSFLDYYYTGKEIRPPYMQGPYEKGLTYYYPKEVNGLTYQKAGSITEFAFGLNPFLKDDEYLPERAAFSAVSGDKISRWSFMPIRNVAASRLLIRNAGPSKEVYAENTFGSALGAYYHTNRGVWVNTSIALGVNWAGTDAKGNALPDDTQVEMFLTLAPEMYVNGETVEWDKLGKGASQTMTFTIDNTEPELKAVAYDKDSNVLSVTLQDNRFAAYVGLLNEEGTRVLKAVSPNQALADQGREITVELSLDGLLASKDAKFMIRLGDYADNQSTYELTGEFDPDMDLSPDINAYYYGYDEWTRTWIAYSKDGSSWAKVGYGSTVGEEEYLSAGAYAKGYVFAFDRKGDFYAYPANKDLPLIGDSQLVGSAEKALYPPLQWRTV